MIAARQFGDMAYSDHCRAAQAAARRLDGWNEARQNNTLGAVGGTPVARAGTRDVPAGERARRTTGRLLPAGVLALLGVLPAAAVAQEDPRIEQMQRQIEALQRQLDELRGEVENRMPPPPERPPQAAGEPVVSGNDKIKLSISGQVNRGILVSEDGDQTKLFFVDNDNSSSSRAHRGYRRGQRGPHRRRGDRGRAALELDARGQPGQREHRDCEFRGPQDRGLFRQRAPRQALDRPGPHGLRRHRRGRPLGDRRGRHLGHRRLRRRAPVRRRRHAVRRHDRRGLQQLRRPLARRPAALRQPALRRLRHLRPRRSPTASSTSPASTAARSATPSSPGRRPGPAMPATSKASTARPRCCWRAASA